MTRRVVRIRFRRLFKRSIVVRSQDVGFEPWGLKTKPGDGYLFDTMYPWGTIKRIEVFSLAYDLPEYSSIEVDDRDGPTLPDVDSDPAAEAGPPAAVGVGAGAEAPVEEAVTE